jgi:hypothetical protein
METNSNNISHYELKTEMDLILQCLKVKDYPVSKGRVFDIGDFYDEYKSSNNIELFIFEGSLYLPNPPKGFEMSHITDKNHSMLIYKYEDGLSRKDLQKEVKEALEDLVSWTIQLPKFVDKAGGDTYCSNQRPTRQKMADNHKQPQRTRLLSRTHKRRTK